MDSKVVNKVIKKHIWPFLKEQGFSKFTSRNAWRLMTLEKCLLWMD
jgi:hypothetical protein